jgi:cobalt-zinc-cadmium efflux system protein
MHDHAHCDHHAPPNFGRAFAVGIALNTGFVIGELGFGFASRSLSLVADAGHNAGDVLGLLMAWVAAVAATRRPNPRRTYGYRRSTILAALANSVLLLVTVGAIAWEAVVRLSAPVEIPGKIVMAVAAVGILVNGGTALMFVRGRDSDLNIAGAYMHMATDALVAFGVVVAGAAMLVTHFAWIDSVVSLLISLLVGIGSWRMLRRSLDLALDAVPEGTDANEIRAYLHALPGVVEVTDLHIWPMSTTEVALTAHVTAPQGLLGKVLIEAQTDLHHRFDIAHSTIQVDSDTPPPCPL